MPNKPDISAPAPFSSMLAYYLRKRAIDNYNWYIEDKAKFGNYSIAITLCAVANAIIDASNDVEFGEKFKTVTECNNVIKELNEVKDKADRINRK